MIRNNKGCSKQVRDERSSFTWMLRLFSFNNKKASHITGNCGPLNLDGKTVKPDSKISREENNPNKV